MKIDKFIEIKKSEIEGIGVFATKNFKEGEVVYSFKKGRIVGLNDIKNLPKGEERYLDKIGDDKFEIVEPPARHVNHSCSPNVIEKERTAYALRDIRKKEEITIDYDKIAYFEKPFKCHCGSKNCIGFVQGTK